MVYISGSNLSCETNRFSNIFVYTVSYKKDNSKVWDLFNDFYTKEAAVQLIQTLVDSEDITLSLDVYLQFVKFKELKCKKVNIKR